MTDRGGAADGWTAAPPRFSPTLVPLFTTGQRERLRSRLLDRARSDPRITGAAITGSAARGAEDRWSDIDLFFGVADGVGVRATVAAWSAFLYDEESALHHFDLEAAPAVYRAFLLPGGLEVDLGFTPAADFGPRGPGFRSVFGAATAGRQLPPDRDHLVGLAWHHVLHARICIERGKPWQAEHWISAIRDQVLALASIRFGLPATYAKGADALDAAVTGHLQTALVRSLDASELERAFRAAVDGLRHELGETDAALAQRLEPSLVELVGEMRTDSDLNRT